jgi:uncharacterized repeat protein (TIGR01451 family)
MTSLFDRLFRYAETYGRSQTHQPRNHRRRLFLERLEDRVTPSGESFSTPVGTIAAGGNAVVQWDATIDQPLTKGIDRVYNQASISGTGLATFRSDDPAAPGQADPTVTLVDRPPTVTGVFVSSSNWTSDFLASLASQGLGSSVYGFALPTGAAQLNSLPWNKLDRVSIRFSENVSVSYDSLSVFGVNTANYALAPPRGFSYDATTFTATWGFAAPIGTDAIRLVLNGSSTGVRSVADGQLLDGEWTDGTSTLNSGNGVAGGNFSFRVNVGDFQRAGKSGLGAPIGNPGGSAVGGWVPPTTPVPPSPAGGVGSTVTATLTAQLVTDLDGDGLADPGDRVRYTLTVFNRGSTATSGVWVDDNLDPRMTLVPGSITPAPPAGPTVTFDAADTATKGSWQGTYGALGYSLAGDATQLPAYAQVALSGQSNWTWASSTTDPRALQSASNPATRVAAGWYGASFSIDVNLTDGKTHTLALYLLDWDGQGRSERVDVLDASTGQVLDTRTVSAFSGGTFLSWDLSGHVKFRVTSLAGPNAIVSGFFLADPAPFGLYNAGPVNEGSTATVTVRSGSGNYTYSYDFNNDGVFEVTGSAFASATVPASYLADGPGTRIVRARVTDSSGAFTDYTTTIQIVNVPPSVALGSSFSAAPGAAINFGATVNDPSPVDTAAGFTYAWDFGDGSTSNQAAPSHTYAALGTYPVKLTVTDKDGGSTTATATATVATPGSFIVTQFEKIPNFGANPTITAAKSGNWSDATTWSLGRLPAAGDVVSIGANTVVTYDLVSDVQVKTVAIQAGGSLQFRTDVNTRLTVINLLVMPGGLLQIGTAANPVPAGVKAEVVFADVPLDLVNDPLQYGNGLIALGKVTMYGAIKNQTFVKLATEPKAGDTTLTLSAPVSGWQVGDRIVLPDTRELYSATRPDTGTYVSQSEMVQVVAISADGLTVTLNQALQYSHLGARDTNGVLTFMPYVSNLTRNVVVRSANPLGTRGYTYFTQRADVDIEYAQFSGLGRTRVDPLDSTTFDASGNLTHVGTNQEGRYSVSFRFLYGPTATPADGYQYTFEGNSVFCPINPMPYRWGIDIGDSHYGLIQDNVLYNWAGAGIVCQWGNESYNVISHNYVSKITGAGTNRADDRGWGDIGHEGSGFWFRGFNNYVRDNVVNQAHFGYTFYSLGQWLQGGMNTQVPLAPGDAPWQPGQFRVVDMTDTPILQFSGNEVYGATDTGLTIWSLGTAVDTPHADAQESVIKNFHVWNVYTKGYYGYETNRLTFDGLVFRGDASVVANYSDGPIAVYSSDYFQQDFTITNSDIQGAKVGWMPSVRSGGVQTIQNSVMRNYWNIVMEHMWRAASTAQDVAARKVIVNNVVFGYLLSADKVDLGPQSNIAMIDKQTTTPQNFVQLDQLFVYSYNGVAGDNFQVYYEGQAASAIVPQSIYNSDGTTQITGFAQAGLSNSQTWSMYGIAVAGAIAPSSAHNRAGIIGLVV